MAELNIYAGRWVALTENNEIASVGVTEQDARYAAHTRRPKEHVRLVWVSRHPPYLPIPAWPLNQIRPHLPTEGVWLAGGPVRDLLLGRSLHDWDFAVEGNGLPLARRVADAIGGDYYPLDIARQTGRVVVTDPATLRPITLDFAALRGETIEADLRKRDFTINAMALTLDGQLIDPTGGQVDLERGMIRITNKHSFNDDPARLLRAVRQANSLGFRLESQTELALQAQAATITTVAPERIRAELVQTLRSEPAAHGLQALENLGLLTHILPEAQALGPVRQSWPHHYRSAWTHTLAAVSALEGVLAIIEGRPRHRTVARFVPVPAWAWTALADTLGHVQSPLLAYLNTDVNADLSRATLTKWGALFHDVGKTKTRTVDEDGRTHFYGHTKTGAQLTQERMEALHFPNKALGFVTTLVREHMRMIGFEKHHPTRRAIYRFYRATEEAGVGVVLLALADSLAVWGKKLKKPHWHALLEAAEKLLESYFEEQNPVVSPPALLTGHDLLAMGFDQGPDLGEALEALREAQAAGEIQTRQDAEAFIRERKNL